MIDSKGICAKDLELRQEIMVDTGRGTLVPLSSYPRWKKDKDGWPIEQIKNKPFTNIIRIILINLRKL